MTMLLLLNSVAGIALGLECTVVALVPAVLVSALAAVLVAGGLGFDALGTMGAIVAGQTLMQVAFLLGVMTRAMLASDSARSLWARRPRDA